MSSVNLISIKSLCQYITFSIILLLKVGVRPSYRVQLQHKHISDDKYIPESMCS